MTRFQPEARPASSPDQTALDAFVATFGGSPAVLARAPGRVELLGNHTDYNGGLVLAAAIDRDTVVVGRRREDRQAEVRSANLDEFEAFSVDALEPGPVGDWGRYVRGVAWALQERDGPLAAGFEAALAGAVPIGAGLSSSASLQAAVALFLLAAGLVPGGASERLDDAARMALAHTLRRSENAFVGVNSGLLDQFSTLFGRAGHALRLDCLTLDYERVPLGTPAPAIVVCDSKTSRRLADGMYNRRREECERVVDYFRGLKGDQAVRLLRDVTLDELREHWDRLDPVGRLRARHVLTENDRVRRGAEALKAGDVATFGRLMSASHASSRDDFANSSAALDALIEAAEAAPGFLGGKLSGAGWAGCTVNLVAAGRAEAFAEAVSRGYARATGVEPAVHICHAADGASGRVFN
jgi:galactokinase